MKRSRYTEEQIIWILKEHAAGQSASTLCRKHGILWASFGGPFESARMMLAHLTLGSCENRFAKVSRQFHAKV
jgi:hypothetical protein